MEGRVRGKRAAIAAGALCLAVLGIAAVVLKDRILEAWYLHCIEEGAPDEVKACGEKLARIASRHTIPGLLGILERNKGRVLSEEDPLSGAFFAVAAAIGPDGFVAVSGALGEKPRGEERRRWLLLPEERIRPLLLSGLGHPAPSVRVEAIRCLQDPRKGLPGDVEQPIFALLDDPDPDVRAQAAVVVAPGRFGDRAVRRELRSAFGRRSPRLRREAAGLISNPEMDIGMAWQGLAAAIEDPDIRAASAQALGFAPGGEAAMPSLLKAAGDPDVGWVASCAIGNLAWELPAGDPVLAPAVPDLLGRLEDPDHKVQIATLFALERIGKPHAEEAVRRVLEAWREGEEPEWARIEFLSRMGAVPERVVPFIMKTVQEYGIDPGAIWVLEKYPLTPEGRMLLLEALKSEEAPDTTMIAAAEALRRWAGDPGVRSGLLAAVADPSYVREIRVAAGEALAGAGEGLHAIEDDLFRILGDPGDPDGAEAAAAAIAGLGRGAAGALPAIANILETSVPESVVVARALLRIEGEAAFGRTPRLAAVLRGKLQGRDAWDAISVLVETGKPAVPFLIEAIAEDDVLLRVRGARILGRIGPGAAAALPALRKLLDDPDDLVLAEARRAIGRIGG